MSYSIMRALCIQRYSAVFLGTALNISPCFRVSTLYQEVHSLVELSLFRLQQHLAETDLWRVVHDFGGKGIPQIIADKRFVIHAAQQPVFAVGRQPEKPVCRRLAAGVFQTDVVIVFFAGFGLPIGKQLNFGNGCQIWLVLQGILPAIGSIVECKKLEIISNNTAS